MYMYVHMTDLTPHLRCMLVHRLDPVNMPDGYVTTMSRTFQICIAIITYSYRHVKSIIAMNRGIMNTYS